MSSSGTESGIILSGNFVSRPVASAERRDAGAWTLKPVCPSCSAISKRCQNLLLQIYLHFPEVIQHVTLPEGTSSSGGAVYSNSCKVRSCV